MNRVLAIVWLRYRLLINRLRHGDGIWHLIGTILLAVLWGLAAVGAAIGVGVVMMGALREGNESLLFKLQVGVFTAATLAGVLLPLVVEKGQGGPVTARLLAFPVTPRQLFWMSQTALAGSADHIFYYPVMIALGMAVWWGQGAVWLGLALVVSIWLTILTWGQAVGLGTEVLLRGRRSREMLAVTVIFLILVMGMGPAVVENYMDGRSLAQLPLLQHVVAWLLAAAQATAPHLGAAGLQAVRRGHPDQAVVSLLGIWFWIGAGLLASRAVFLKYYLGAKGKLPSGKIKDSVTRNTCLKVCVTLEGIIPDGILPPVVVANAIKDLRINLRSLAGRLILVLAPLLMGFVGWTVFKDVTEAYLGLQSGDLRFFGMLVYVSLTANSQSINNMAYEGSGVANYFLLPVSLAEVLLGKNIGLWLYQTLVLTICLIVLAVVGSLPGILTVISGILVYCSLVVFRTATGNIMSCRFPSPRRMSSRKENTSNLSNLLSLVFPLVFVPVIWVFAAMPWVLGHPELQPVALLILLALTLTGEVLSLRPVARLMNQRRENIMAALRMNSE